MGNEYMQEGKGTPKDKLNLPINLKDVKRVILTHAHADHMGSLLLAQSRGQNADMYGTPARPSCNAAVCR